MVAPTELMATQGSRAKLPRLRFFNNAGRIYVVVLNDNCCGTLILWDTSPTFVSNFGPKFGSKYGLVFFTTLHS